MDNICLKFQTGMLLKSYPQKALRIQGSETIQNSIAQTTACKIKLITRGGGRFRFPDVSYLASIVHSNVIERTKNLCSTTLGRNICKSARLGFKQCKEARYLRALLLVSHNMHLVSIYACSVNAYRFSASAQIFSYRQFLISGKLAQT